MKVTVSKEINADISKVFDLFTDIKNLKKNIEGIINVEIVSKNTSGSGVTWKETREMFGQKATVEMQITSVKEPEYFIVESDDRGTMYKNTYTFSSKDSGTLVTLEFVGKPQTLIAKLLTPLALLFQGTTKKLLEKDMDELKAIAESN